MGKLIAFWSPYKGKAKVTASLCAIAGMFGMQYPEISVAISHTPWNDLELEEKLDPQSGAEIKSDVYKKSGIAALKLNYRQASLSSDKIKRSAIPLRMKSLYLYPNTEQEADELNFCLLTEILKGEFSCVFLDVESGRTETSKKYLDASDYIVVVLPQSPGYWKHFLQREAEVLKEKQYCILFGGFLENSKFGKRFYGKTKETGTEIEIAGEIPMNTGFFDAMTEGRVLEFFLRNQLVRKKEENYEFIVQTKNAAQFIKNNILLSGVTESGTGIIV